MYAYEKDKKEKKRKEREGQAGRQEGGAEEKVKEVVFLKHRSL